MEIKGTPRRKSAGQNLTCELVQEIAEEITYGDDADRPAFIIQANEAPKFDVSEKFKD